MEVDSESLQVKATEKIRVVGYEYRSPKESQGFSMFNEDGSQHTAHTLNPVPVSLVSNEKFSLKNGVLADIAPTILDLLDMEKPKEMTGNSLIK